MAAKTQERRYLSADAILALEDQKTEDVYVAQWETYVTIRSMTGSERDHYEASLTSWTRDARGAPQVKGIELENIRARLVSLVAIDHETGKRLFSEQQVMALGQKNAAALDELFSAAQRLSNITAPAIEAAKEALGKAPSDASGSALPAM